MLKHRVLISVTDKTGIEKFSKLAQIGYEIVSTGGTAKALTAAGIPVTPIEQVTGFPEMMNGRVKTLHPKIFGGILSVRGNANHEASLNEHRIAPIDIVVVNLYNFAGRPDIDEIDIGGPSLIRAAAKNGIATIPVIDPADYDMVINSVISGGLSDGQREYLVMKVFKTTAEYDRQIFEWMKREYDAPRKFLAPAGPSAH